MSLTFYPDPSGLRTDENAIRFSVYGHARPGGSKRAFKHPSTGQIIVKEDSENRSWRETVARAGVMARAQVPGAAARMQAGHELELLTVPLEVEFTFYRPRGKSHFGTGRNAGVLKPSAPEWPATRPDVLKLARAAEDALSGTLYRDDAQIVTETLRKRWGEPERVEIVVRVLG